MARNITIKDIAEASGFSKSTVAYILSNDKNYKPKPDTRKIVMETAERLGYKTNYLAKALISKRSNTVGILFPFIAHSFYSELVMKLQICLQKADYTGLFMYYANPTGFRTALDTFIGRKVDGIISVPEAAHSFSLLKETGLPLVIYGDAVSGFDCVVANVAESFEKLTTHLLNLGRRKISFIGLVKSDRYKGFSSAHEKAGLKIDPRFTIDGMGFRETGYYQMKKLLSSQDIPDGLVAQNDIVALGAIRALYEKGIKVPEDFSVVGYDNVKESRYSIPSITTMKISGTSTAQILANLILNRISDSSRKVQHFRLNTEFIIRESCGYKQIRGASHEAE